MGLKLKSINTRLLKCYDERRVYVAGNPLQQTDPTGEFSLHLHHFWDSRDFAIGLAAGELVLGTALIATGVGAAGGGMLIGASVAAIAGGAALGAGIAGESYAGSHKGSSFKGKYYYDADAGGAVSGAEIAAGVVVTAATGGMAGRIGGNTLICMGFRGLAYSSEAGNNFSWGINAQGTGFGAQQLYGAEQGVITGGFGELGGLGDLAGDSLSECSETTQFAAKWSIKVGSGFGGGFASNLTTQETQRGLEKKKYRTGLNFKSAAIVGSFGAGGVLFSGALGGGLSNVSNAEDLDDTASNGQKFVNGWKVFANYDGSPGIVAKVVPNQRFFWWSKDSKHW